MNSSHWKEIYAEDIRMTGLHKLDFIHRMFDRRFRFYRSLRKTEYYTNYRKDFFGKAYARFLRLRHHLLCDKY